jgi:hypothetical protein
MRLFMPVTLCISLLFAIIPSRGDPEKPKQEDAPVVQKETGKDGKKSKVVNTVSIAAKDPNKVFDIITSARFWKTWHPATYAVAGVTERPYLLDDVIHERVQAVGKDFVITWKVVQHDRPKLVVLESKKSPLRITYSFKAQGEAVEFTRELEYDEALVRKALPDVKDFHRLNHEQSEEALNRLKELVEKTLRAEAAGF